MRIRVEHLRERPLSGGTAGSSRPIEDVGRRVLGARKQKLDLSSGSRPASDSKAIIDLFLRASALNSLSTLRC